MRIEWDESRCARAGLCTALAPDIFNFTTDDQLEITVDTTDDAQRNMLQHAADSCPTRAINLMD